MRWQAIYWSSISPIPCCLMASPGTNDLIDAIQFQGMSQMILLNGYWRLRILTCHQINPWHTGSVLRYIKICTSISSIRNISMIHIFVFSIMFWYWEGTGSWNLFQWTHKTVFVLQFPCHACWWPGNTRSQGISGLGVNSLWPSDAIWRQRSGSAMAQVMACCLTAPSHYLNQCWLIISEAQWRQH